MTISVSFFSLPGDATGLRDVRQWTCGSKGSWGGGERTEQEIPDAIVHV